jgi:LCP family protein required for cell wall assembly
MSSRRRRNLLRTLAILVALVVVLAGAGALYGYRYADRLVAKGQRPVAGLTPAGGQAMNILLVGSDSRDGLSRRQLGRIQTVEVAGRRTDTIMVLHVSPDRDKPVLLSLPRDLRATINGRTGKINAAFAFGGPDLLVKTVRETTGLPINHYVEIDFAGFQKLVDEIGGVTVCTYVPAQDTHSGLRLDPGCTNVNGSQALAYARSRYYEEWKDGDWHVDGTADLGRIKRQQLFIRSAVEKLLGEMESDPFKVGQLVGVATSVVTVDQGLDPLKAAAALRQAAEVGLSTYSLPVVGAEHKGQSALDIDAAKAQPILDYFRGTGPQPPEESPPTTGG